MSITPPAGQPGKTTTSASWANWWIFADHFELTAHTGFDE